MTYQVEVANDAGCSDVDSVTVTVMPLPSIAVRPDTTICRDDSATLSAAGGIRYRWSPADGLSCTDCAAPLARPSATTTYTVEAFNAEGCSITKGVTVDVRECVRKADFGMSAFPGVMLCDSTAQICRLTNVGETPVLVQSLRLVGGDTTAFTLSTENLLLPRWMAPQEEWSLPVRFHPSTEGQCVAVLRAYLKGAGDSISATILGEGRRTTLDFQLQPDNGITVPGDTVFFSLSCQGPSWSDALLTHFIAEVRTDADGIVPDTVQARTCAPILMEACLIQKAGGRKISFPNRRLG